MAKSQTVEMNHDATGHHYDQDVKTDLSVRDTDIRDARDGFEMARRKLTKNGSLVEIHIGDGRPMIVDRRHEPNMGSGKADSVIETTPHTLLQLLMGAMDPRYAMLYQRIKVTGSVAVATALLDELAGRNISNAMAVDPSELPQPTEDLELARAQIQRFGYAIVKNALSPAEVRALHDRLVEQAAAESEIGADWRDETYDGSEQPNQRVWTLINKGEVFRKLLEHPIPDYFLPELLGEYYLLATCHANIAGPGGKPMFLHTDQVAIQPPIPQTRIGVNILWFLDDVTEENGGTRIMPGSHIGNVAPRNIFTTDGTIAAQGPAGCALIYDSRVWHGTGANVTKDKKRHVIISYYMRAWLRTVENHTLAVKPEVLATMSDKVKTLLGFRVTGNLGGVCGPFEGSLVTQNPSVVGELKPRKTS